MIWAGCLMNSVWHAPPLPYAAKVTTRFRLIRPFAVWASITTRRQWIAPLRSARPSLMGRSTAARAFYRNWANSRTVALGCRGNAEVAEYAAARRIALSVEFLHRFETYFLNTTAAAAQFVKDVGEPNVGIHYDTFHAHIERPTSRRSTNMVRLSTMCISQKTTGAFRGRVLCAGMKPLRHFGT